MQVEVRLFPAVETVTSNGKAQAVWVSRMQPQLMGAACDGSKEDQRSAFVMPQDSVLSQRRLAVGVHFLFPCKATDGAESEVDLPLWLFDVPINPGQVALMGGASHKLCLNLRL